MFKNQYAFLVLSILFHLVLLSLLFWAFPKLQKPSFQNDYNQEWEISLIPSTLEPKKEKTPLHTKKEITSPLLNEPQVTSKTKQIPQLNSPVNQATPERNKTNQISHPIVQKKQSSSSSKKKNHPPIKNSKSNQQSSVKLSSVKKPVTTRNSIAPKPPQKSLQKNRMATSRSLLALSKPGAGLFTTQMSQHTPSKILSAPNFKNINITPSPIKPTQSKQRQRVKRIPAKITHLSWKYPKKSLRRGEEGVVTVLFHITEAGKIRHIQVINSSNYPRLDMAAVEAVKNAKVIPASIGTKQIASDKKIRIRFQLPR